MTGGFFKNAGKLAKLASPSEERGDWWMVALDIVANLASPYRNGMVALDMVPT